MNEDEKNINEENINEENNQFNFIAQSQKLGQSKALNDIQNEITQIKEEANNSKHVILFASFDIVNFTEFKDVFSTGWSSVLLQIFKSIELKLLDYSKYQFWKTVGDEIIFIVEVNDMMDLPARVEEIYGVLNAICDQLKNGTFYGNDSSNLSNTEVGVMKKQKLISLKATAWIANVLHKAESGDYNKFIFDNVLMNQEYGNSQNESVGYQEFQGNDIDAGFRISRHTMERRLIISYELAFLLNELKKGGNSWNFEKWQLRIVTYSHLKGVWKRKPYPIIWYYLKDGPDANEFEDSFYYYERIENELVKEFFDWFENDIYKIDLLNKKMYSDIDFALEKIAEDLDFKDKLNNIKKEIEKKEKSELIMFPNLVNKLHCVCICLTADYKKVLIAKRSDSRENHPGLWEFGCAKVDIASRIEEKIKTEYLEDFGVNIEVFKNEKRTEDSQLIPVAMFEIHKLGNRKHTKQKANIFVAKITNSNDEIKVIVDNFNKENEKGKHSELRLIDIDDRLIDDEESLILDFKESLTNAVEIAQRHTNA